MQDIRSGDEQSFSPIDMQILMMLEEQKSSILSDMGRHKLTPSEIDLLKQRLHDIDIEISRILDKLND